MQGDIGGEQPGPPIQPGEAQKPAGIVKPLGLTGDPLAPKENIQVPEQPVLSQTEWDSILNLGRKSDLDLTDQERNDYEGLKLKGRNSLGDNFGTELSRRNIERKQVEQERARRVNEEDQRRRSGLADKLNAIADASKQEMADLLKGFDSRSVTRQAEGDKGLQAIMDEATKLAEKPQNLQDVLSNPEMSQARAELSWIRVLTGQEIPGLDPKLREEIFKLKQDGTTMILTDPIGYQAEFDRLKAEFFRSQTTPPPVRPNSPGQKP